MTPASPSGLPAIYDAFAEIYEANRGLFDLSEVFRTFQAHLPDGPGDLLDLGCGAGDGAAGHFLAQGWRVTGVDFSRAMLDLARRLAPTLRTFHQDMREAAFDDAAFDAVTAIYCLFHVPRTDHPALFRRVRRWLRPGGKFLFTYATEAYTGAPAFDGFKAFMGRQLYYSHETPETLLAQLAQAGLDVEALENREIGGETFLWVRVGRNCGENSKTRTTK